MDETKTRKKKSAMILKILIAFLVITTLVAVYYIGVQNKQPKGEMMYEHTQARMFGTSWIAITQNGELYTDSETENPNHVHKWHYQGKFSKEQLEEIKEIIVNSTDKEETFYKIWNYKIK